MFFSKANVLTLMGVNIHHTKGCIVGLDDVSCEQMDWKGGRKGEEKFEDMTFDSQEGLFGQVSSTYIQNMYRITYALTLTLTHIHLLICKHM